MWQGEESSSGIELFTRQPWRNWRLISTLLVGVQASGVSIQFNHGWTRMNTDRERISAMQTISPISEAFPVP
jgi:hypothetical protein